MFQLEDWGVIPNQFLYQEDPELERVIDPNHMYEAYKNSIRGVTWKASVQRYCIDFLTRITNSINMIKAGTYIPREPFEFTLDERGHTRYIKSVYIEDRIIQRSLNDNVLMPSVANFLIYDNGASQTGKGLSFAREEFKKHLINACFKFGPDEGYILIIDFSKYFDNIIHAHILNMLRDFVTDKEYNLIVSIFNQFKIDVSYMTDDEYASCLDNIFNALEYSLINKELLTGERFMYKSVGIGNQISQIAGIYYPHEIDNYIKIVKGIKYYGRYMDDSYVICRTKEECLFILNDISTIATKYGIHINTKKTHIQRLHDQKIKYLKILYTAFSKPNGRILEIVPQETFIREYKRLHKFRGLYLENRMPFIDILQCFLSWKGSYEMYTYSLPSTNHMELIFKTLFGIDYNTDLKILCHQLNKEEKEIEMSKVSLNV